MNPPEAFRIGALAPDKPKLENIVVLGRKHTVVERYGMIFMHHNKAGTAPERKPGLPPERKPGDEERRGPRSEEDRDLKRGERVERVKYGVDEDVCTGDHACIRLSGCPSLSLKRLDDPLRDDPVASIGGYGH